MTTIHLALAFDHELSLGGVHNTYADDLFDPTNAILETANALDVPVTLFTDVLAATKFREWHIPEFFDPYERQLKQSLGYGHDVQLHLHPHWIETQLVDGRILPSMRYSLGDFESGSPSIADIVRSGVDYLNSVCREVKPDYECVAFRAGGFCIQRATGPILKALWNNGIRIDSSVPPGFRFSSSIFDVDFSSAPRATNWHVSPERRIEEPAANGLLEVPIATIPRHPINNIVALGKRIVHRKRAPRASGVPLYDVDASITEKLKRLLPFSAWMLSFDYHYVSPRYLLSLLQRYISQRPNSREIFVSSVSHPKSMGHYNRELMKGFIEEARKEYGRSLRFCTFEDLSRMASK